MAEKKCCCRCGARLFWLAAAVLVVLIAVFARSCAKELQPAPQPAQPQPERPMTATERIRALIDERVADTNYMANLDLLADRNEKLGTRHSEATEEFDKWRSAFLAANAEARELTAKLAEARASAQETAAGLEAQLKGLYMADAKGAELLGALEKIELDIEANKRLAADYIGARLRKQTDKN